MHKHPIVHIEISAKDREAAAQFYHEIFGWEIQHMPEMNYYTIMCDEKLGGGFNPVVKFHSGPVVSSPVLSLVTILQ